MVLAAFLVEPRQAVISPSWLMVLHNPIHLAAAPLMVEIVTPVRNRQGAANAIGLGREQVCRW
jgi:hypothetical protein